MYLKHHLVIIQCDLLEDRIVDRGNGVMINSCGLDYVVLIVMNGIACVFIHCCVSYCGVAC